MVGQTTSFSKRCLDVLARTKYLSREAACSDSFASPPQFLDEQDHVLVYTREGLPLALFCGKVCRDDRALESTCDIQC